jgi:hypothetical protein
MCVVLRELTHIDHACDPAPRLCQSMGMALVLLIPAWLGYQDGSIQSHYPRHSSQKLILILYFTTLIVTVTQ